MFSRLFTILSFFFLFWAITGCDNAKEGAREQISYLESRLYSTPNDEQYVALVTLYVQYVQRYPDDELAPIYLYRVAEAYFRASNWAYCAKHLQMILDKYPKTPITEEALLFAGVVYEERLFDKVRAEAVFTRYKNEFPQGKGIERAQIFFKTDDQKLEYRIQELQKSLQANPNNFQAIGMMATLCNSFTQRFPQNPNSPNYCMQGAKYAASIGESLVAVELWTRIYENYADFAMRPEVMLLLGMEHEEKLPLKIQNMRAINAPFFGFAERYKDFQAPDFQNVAKKYYQEIIDKYPTSDVADDAAAAIKNLGKTPNEIVHSFVNKKDSAK